MRLSKQSAPLVDSYDITVSKDELRLIHAGLQAAIHAADEKSERTFHSVNLNDRKEQLYERMTTKDKLLQMKGSIDQVKGILD